MEDVERQWRLQAKSWEAEARAMHVLLCEKDVEIERLKAEIEDWKELVSGEAIRRADTQQKVDQLRTALQRIDGINDNPACYNPMIEEVLRAALEPKL